MFGPERIASLPPNQRNDLLRHPETFKRDSLLSVLLNLVEPEAAFQERFQVDEDESRRLLNPHLPYVLRKGIPLVYYAFDLLRLDGTDLRSRALIERREQLAKLLKKAPWNIKLSEELQETREELLQVARHFQSKG